MTDSSHVQFEPSGFPSTNLIQDAVQEQNGLVCKTPSLIPQTMVFHIPRVSTSQTCFLVSSCLVRVRVRIRSLRKVSCYEAALPYRYHS